MRRPDLVPDCASCAALCCVATSFDASDDFAFDKAAGVPCRYLTRTCHCGIHTDLVERGFRGCAVYDCYGAGQRATRAFAEAERNEAFLILRVVHELLWFLTEAEKLCPPSHEVLREQIQRKVESLDAIARGPAQSLFNVDLRVHQETSEQLLRCVGAALGGRGSTG